MKSEPLKKKIEKFHPAKSEINVVEGFSEQDIRSAVEWLKEKQKRKLHELWVRDNCLLSTAYEEMLDLTDEAFEDVIENKKN